MNAAWHAHRRATMSGVPPVPRDPNPALTSTTLEARIPYVFHWLWISQAKQSIDGAPTLYAMQKLTQNFTVLSPLHYLSIASTLRCNPDATGILHCDRAPGGPLFDRLLTTFPRFHTEHRPAPDDIFGRPLHYNGQRSDVMRNQILIEQGGIYLDLDVVSLASLADLRHHKCVLAKEGNYGLANSMMMAEPQSTFLEAWLDQYHWFDGSRDGRTKWAKFSVHLAYTLAQLPSLERDRTILSDRMFACEYGDQLKRWLGLTAPIRSLRSLLRPETRLLHFGQAGGANHLAVITEDWLKTSPAPLAELTRQRSLLCDSASLPQPSTPSLTQD